MDEAISSTECSPRKVTTSRTLPGKHRSSPWSTGSKRSHCHRADSASDGFLAPALRALSPLPAAATEDSCRAWIATIPPPMDVSHLLDALNDAQRQAVDRAARADAGARGRGQRQDARAHASRRVAGAGRERLAARHPGRDLHQQGRRRDARAHRDPARRCRRRRSGSAPSTASRIGCCACTGAKPACRSPSRSSTPRTSSGSCARSSARSSSTRRAGCRRRSPGSSTRRRTRACGRSTSRTRATRPAGR